MAKKVKAENPWLSIWIHPRETIRAIIETHLKYGFLILCVFNGLPMALNFAQNFSLVSVFPTWSIVVAALVICPFLGYISIYISSWLLSITGKWVGGKGAFQPIRAAVAWSNVPNAVTCLTW